MKKRPTDPNRLAKQIIDEAAANVEKNPFAVALGRRGGLKGGKARAEKLSAEERAEIARKAAAARWKKN
ncbi:MAG: histone H1 [Pseudolabrys sp.]|nr:histone H1 [Pseudolabrys sp.]